MSDTWGSDPWDPHRSGEWGSRVPHLNGVAFSVSALLLHSLYMGLAVIVGHCTVLGYLHQSHTI